MLLGHTEIVHCDKYVSFLKKKTNVVWLAKAWVLTGKRVILSKILYDRMKIKVKANGA